MADAQIAIIDGDQTQVVLAPGENPAIVTSIPGPQGPAGAGVPTGGAANEVLYKVSSTFGDTAWGPITSAMIGDLQIVNADVSASAGIAYSKLATLTSGNIVLGNASNVATSTAVTGDVTISNAGVTAISSGVIVDADVNASAAIAGTKISPNFGSQNVTTTGTSTAASFIPTSSTAPTNGLYLSAANSVALSTNGTGRLFVDASGRLGVGTASPGALFHSSASNNGPTTVGLFENTSTGAAAYTNIQLKAGTNTALIGLGSSGTATGNLYIGNDQNKDLDLYTGSANIKFLIASTERLRITSAGFVGVGTNAPSGLFHIRSAAGTTAAFYITTSATTDDSAIYFGDNNSSSSGRIIYDHDTDSMAFSTNLVERLRIDSSGRVGIGTTSPTRTFEVVSPNTTLARFQGPEYAQVTHSDGTRTLYTQVYNNLAVLATATNTPLMFGIQDVERARIDTSGRLLVGTSSSRGSFFNSTGSDCNLQVEGTSLGSSSVSIIRNQNNIGPSYLILGKTRGAAVGGTTIVNDSDFIGVLSYQASDGTDFVEAATISAQVDGTPGANDMPGRLVFSTTADGAASPTERMRLTSTGQLRLAGAGITFNGDTATANELDDYEEGTFTPTVVGTTTAGTATYAAQIGRYTKIGNLVNFTVYLSWSGGTGSGDLKVNGLPFTINSESNRLFACSVAWVEGLSLTAGHVPQAALYNNETRINIQSYPTGGTSFANVAYDAGAAIAITGSYTV